MIKDSRIKIHTGREKGAKSPDPVADSLGRFIKTTHSPVSRLGEYDIKSEYSGNTGKKAAEISAS